MDSSFWQPTAAVATLQLRAKVLAEIRQFFAKRDVMEVETPLACANPVTDPFLEAMQTQWRLPGAKSQTLYLQTSPEYAMKRLLAAGSGSIYQICKAFRNDEQGDYHNPEFTLLEWYQLNYDHHQLMDEVAQLVCLVLTLQPITKISYQQLFQQYLNLDPLSCDLAELQQCANELGVGKVLGLEHPDKDDYLQLLFSYHLEPRLQGVWMVYDYPCSQAALAKLSEEDARVAERFEVYVNGVELANGYHELTDAQQQSQRFAQDLQKRSLLDKDIVAVDQRLIAALKQGLPPCAGVALGLDRLLMIATKQASIDKVISFDTRHA